VLTEQQHKHTDKQYPGDNFTSQMANVRGLLVLSFVCLLLCQVMLKALFHLFRNTKLCTSN
ncbi:hypothetical protein LSAT2_029068, partial [Lamellibrachia satsuma]